MESLADKLLNPSILPCSCHSEAELLNGYISSQKRKHFYVHCGACRNQGVEHIESWLAILNWNKSKLSELPTVIDVPHLHLGGVSSQGISDLLEEDRLTQEGLIRDFREQQLPKNSPQFLLARAKLNWDIYALSILRAKLLLTDSSK